MTLRISLLLGAALCACSNPAPKAATDTDSKVAARAAEPARRALLKLGGEMVYEDQLKTKLSQQLKTHDALAGLQRWQLMKRIAMEAAMEQAAAKAAKDSGLPLEVYREKAMRELGQQPVTPEILRAVYEGNKESLGFQPFEEVKDLLQKQLEQQFARDAQVEFQRQLLRMYKFEDQVEPPELPRFKAGSATAPTLGPDNAPITVVVFSDFECPYCARQARLVIQMARHYGRLVRWQFRHFPLSFHQNARLASRGSICAHRQEKFWSFHDRMFELRSGYDDAGLTAHAKAVGVADVAAFQKCLGEIEALDTIIDADLKAGEELGVESTPSVYMNGMPVHGIAPKLVGELIDHELRRLGHQPPVIPEPQTGPPGGSFGAPGGEPPHNHAH